MTVAANPFIPIIDALLKGGAKISPFLFSVILNAVKNLSTLKRWSFVSNNWILRSSLCFELKDDDEEGLRSK